MADNLPHPRALRRRARRRAEREVGNIIRIQELRNQLLNHEIINVPSDSDASSGNIETESEPEGERSPSDLSDHDNIAAPDDFINNAGNNGCHNPAVLLAENVALLDGDIEGFQNDAMLDENVAMPDGNLEDDFQNDIDNADELVGEGVELTDEEKEQYVIQALREWASSGGVLSMRKVDELLAKLCFVFHNMPKSYKTLLGTAANLGIEVRGDFKFWYKGITANLDQLTLDKYLEVNGSIKMDVNMDGLPLFKDTSKEKIKKFWPILGKQVGSEEDPFIIGIYCGESDPTDVDLYLADFVIELESLQNNGYRYNGVRYEVSVRNFVLDAPGRSLIKCCVGHGGYGACEKCEVVGQYVRGRVCFANIGADCRARTDESYSRRLDRLHHCGRSPLEFINVGMVSQFRLDTMHLLYKGAFSRFLDALLTWEGDWNLTEANFSDISVKLVGFVQSCPRDFNRKPRKFEKYYKYKATELRRLLLYDGVVAFEGNMDENVYKLFLLLHCAIYILANSYLNAHLGAKARLNDSSYETEKELGIGKRRRRVAKRLSSDDEQENVIIRKKNKKVSSDDENVIVQKKSESQQKATGIPAAPLILLPSANQTVSFLAKKTAKSPMKVVTQSKSREREINNNSTLKIVRKDKGSKAKSMTELKDILDAKKQEAEQAKLKKLLVSCTSPNWKSSKMCGSDEDKANSESGDNNDLNNSSHSLSFDADQNSPATKKTVMSPSADDDWLSPRKQTPVKIKSPPIVDLLQSPDKTRSTPRSPRSHIDKKLFEQSSSPLRSAAVYSDFERKVLVLKFFFSFLALKEINEKVETVSTNQTKLNLHLIPNEKVLSKPTGMPTLPVKTIKDLGNLIKALKDPTNISTLDAEQEGRSAMKVMTELLANCVAKHYNFAGNKGKLGFAQTPLWTVVKGAVSLKLETNLSETEKQVKTWLKDAPWRTQEDGADPKQRSCSAGPSMTGSETDRSRKDDKEKGKSGRTGKKQDKSKKND